MTSSEVDDAAISTPAIRLTHQLSQIINVVVLSNYIANTMSGPPLPPSAAYTALSNTQTRLLYNKTTHIYRKLTKTTASISILQFCIKENIIPPSFKITNNLNRLDSEAVTKTNNILNQAANNTIKITIENLKRTEKNKVEGETLSSKTYTLVL